MSQSREEARPHYHTRAHQHTQYKPLITWSDILHYRLSLHPPLIRTAVTEDPFHKSVSATVQRGPAQWITTSGTGGTHQKISPVWVDSPHMSKPLYLSKKKDPTKEKRTGWRKKAGWLWIPAAPSSGVLTKHLQNELHYSYPAHVKLGRRKRQASNLFSIDMFALSREHVSILMLAVISIHSQA